MLTSQDRDVFQLVWASVPNPQ